jgi:DnaJ homolog subfamily C member 19
VKLIWLLVLLIGGCKLLLGRWPWELLTASTRSKAEARARALLGLRRQASREEIIEAHRRLLAMVHPDRGGSGEQVHEANAARDLLLDRLLPSETEQR